MEDSELTETDIFLVYFSLNREDLFSYLLRYIEVLTLIVLLDSSQG